MRYEYKFFDISGEQTIEAVENKLNELAAQEWEFVQLIHQNALVLCKKPYYQAQVIREEETNVTK